MALAPKTPQTDALERDLIDTVARHGYPGATVTFYDPPQKSGEIGIRIYLAEAWRPK